MANNATCIVKSEIFVDEASPHIEWVPIVQRNLTEIVNDALNEEDEADIEERRQYESSRQREKLARIGKMLNVSLTLIG
ncbi:unnamed protein product [Toxocara canis]|uniref:Uncharacterized protein n=1 Tax=Toxocara canis TaxID=6265 RepID=A0A183UU25_TOXCA|nr:unnamed protein product [Toxocara canis]